MILKKSLFVSSELIRQEIEEKFNDIKFNLSKDYKFYQIRLLTLNAKKNESLEVAENFEKN